MAEPQRRPWGWVVLALATAGIATGCTAYLAEEGDPAAPVLVQGRVVDASGGGMSGATLTVQGYGAAEPGSDGPHRVVYEGTFRAGLDGTFVVRLAPTPELTGARGADDTVRFGLLAYAGAPALEFSRLLGEGSWAGEVPSFVLGPDGVVRRGVAPAAAVLAAPGP